MQASPAYLSLNDKDIFLKELRAVTGPSHKQLEGLSLSKAIVSPQLSLEQYALYLSKMQAFVTAFEQQLFPALKPVFDDIASRTKASWLQSDLSVLHSMGVQLPVIPGFHFKAGLPEPFLAGAMYVLEGSTLGGKFIYKNVNATLSLTPEKGAAYFNGYGALTGKQWSSFLEQLCAYATAENKDQIYKGADETFKLMFDLLSS